MKVYEMAFRDRDDAGDIVIWIATDGNITTGYMSSALYCKEININSDTAGVDLIIKCEEK